MSLNKRVKKINVYCEVSQNHPLFRVSVPLSVFLRILPYQLKESLHINILKP